MRKTILAALFAILAALPLVSAPAATAALVPATNFQVASPTTTPAVPVCYNERFNTSSIDIAFCRSLDNFYVNDQAADGRSSGLQWRYGNVTGMCQHRAGADDPDNYGYIRVCKDPAALPNQYGLVFEVRAGTCTFQQFECREPGNWRWDTVWLRWVG